MKRFDSLKDAEKFLSIELERLLEYWCPLMNSHCRKNCVCFKTPELIKKTNSVTTGGCTNRMFTAAAPDYHGVL